MERRAIDRRIFSYSAHVPERRNPSYDRRAGTDRRKNGDRREII